jgi:hypothetical protein
MFKEILTGMGIIAAVYIFYKLLSISSRPSREFREEMEEILTSEKYKVKGKFEGRV